MSNTMNQDQIDAARWRALVTRGEIFKINTFDSGAVFQVSIGTDWEHKTMTEAIDAMVESPEVVVGQGDVGEEL